jgi:hypothetical protein
VCSVEPTCEVLRVVRCWQSRLTQSGVPLARICVSVSTGFPMHRLETITSIGVEFEAANTVLMRSRDV